uniref:RING-type E3 ubiquitin transferase n=1 Tax=Diabrotica virgifera virgifera TaxID=50390 RepID=A0A6P7H4A0_DIAVI
MATKENSETLEQRLISQFECPVCFKYVSPPIRLCVSGHSFCTNCFENLNKCAVCREKMSPNRCILLEKLHAFLTFPCKYLDKGCSFSGKGDLRTNHQEYCEFSSTTCPLGYTSCDWTGLRSEMIDHCKTNHPGNIFFQNKNRVKLHNFHLGKSMTYHYLVYIHDTLFRCAWDLREESGLMRFAVYSLGKPSSDKTFCFTIKMFLKNTNKKVVSMSGPCYALKNEDRSFIKKKYLTTNFEMIKDLVDNDNVLYHSIGIIDRNLVLPPIIETKGKIESNTENKNEIESESEIESV